MSGLVTALPLQEAAGSSDAGRELISQLTAAMSPCTRRSLLYRFEGHGLTVQMDGYLADGATAAGEEGNPAERVAEVYRREGRAGVERLDGSFVILIADERERTAYLWTDRYATRPAYWAKAGGYLLIAPEVKCFAGVEGVDRGIRPGSLIAMTLNACLVDHHTYWRGVSLLGPASRLTVRNGKYEIVQYWQRSYQPDSSKDGPTAEQVAEAYTDAVRRHVSCFSRPVVALSGGHDSRVILAACRRAGLNVDAITWGVDGLTDANADFQTGRQVAAAAGCAHTIRLMRLDEFPRHVERVVWLTDGMVGHIGAHPEGDLVFRELAEKHDAVIVGNHLLDGGKFVRSLNEGLHQVSLNFGHGLLLARCLMRRDRAGDIVRDYLDQRRELLASLGGLTEPNEIKDVLYWRARFPRLIASQSPVYRSHIEYVSPLMDAKVVALDVHCSVWDRSDKHLISDLLPRSFPEAYGVPVAERHSRANWRQRLSEMGPAQRYIAETILEPLRSFDEWFDPRAVRAWLALAMAEARGAPWPAGTGTVGRWASSLRANVFRQTVKARRVVNLLTLKLWFARFASGG